MLINSQYVSNIHANKQLVYRENRSLKKCYLEFKLYSLTLNSIEILWINAISKTRKPTYSWKFKTILHFYELVAISYEFVQSYSYVFVWFAYRPHRPFDLGVDLHAFFF